MTLKVINLWAGPGAGKSTTAAGLFNLMKLAGCKVELVTEYAKDVTYEKNFGLLKDQLLLLAEQHRRLARLVGQVEWAITDSPLPLGLAYCPDADLQWLPYAIAGCFRKYDNKNFRIKRVKAYQTYGRNQTEAEALAIDLLVAELVAAYSTRTVHLPGDSAAPYSIAHTLGVIPEDWRSPFT